MFAEIEPMILSVVEGYNTCLMAYGQTGGNRDCDDGGGDDGDDDDDDVNVDDNGGD